MLTEEEVILLRLNNQLCYFSPNGIYLVVAFQTNLLIKDSKQLETIHSFVFTDAIEYVEWSPNSEYILCANIKKAVIQVYSINYPQWKCRLIDGSSGLSSVTWSPDSKSLLTLSDFNIQISVWSLETRQVSHIQNLKSSAFNKLHFTTDGCRLAVIVTEEGEDGVNIYKTSTWHLHRKLICERLNSIDGISWSPNGELLCIWCSTTDEPKLIVYSSPLEKNIAVFCPAKEKNSTERRFHHQRELIGIDTVVWSPSGQLLAVIGFNEMVLLLNHVTWKPLLQLYFDPVIRDNSYLNKVYAEGVKRGKVSIKTNGPVGKHFLEELHERPINIRIDKKDVFDKPSTIAVTELFTFSPCGQYAAAKHQLYPTTLWIWNIISDYFEYILLENNIVAVKWHPKQACLMVFCESAHIFEWTPQTAKCIATPRNITVLDGRWNPNGKSIILCGYNKAVVYHVDTDS